MKPLLLITVCLATFAGLGLARAATLDPVTLSKPKEKNLGWRFENGPEFPGATGRLEVDETEARAGQPSLKLTSDFSQGGNYVQASTGAGNLEAGELSFWVKNLKGDSLPVRVVDSGGRCHQFLLQARPETGWQRLRLNLEAFFSPQGSEGAAPGLLKYQSWGPGQDGRWSGAVTSVAILQWKDVIGADAHPIWISEVNLTPAMATRFLTGFEREDVLGADWSKQGAIELDAETAFRGRRSLRLRKTRETLRQTVAVASPAIPVAGGVYRAQFATRTELESMDSSYRGELKLVFQDAAGRECGQAILAEPFRIASWELERKEVEIPAEAKTARFVASIEKESLGDFWIDDLGLSLMPGRGPSGKISRLMFSTAEVGNLLFPDSPRLATMEVWSATPLPENSLRAQASLRDYWAAEQGESIPVLLQETGRRQGKIIYQGAVSFSQIPLEIGRYYELHGQVTQEGGDPFTDHSSLAILPPAATHAFKPEEVPFAGRTWDNRVAEYVRLTHRLGIRWVGIWGNMDPDMDKVDAPQIELAQELGMGVLTGTPAQLVEARQKGYERYTEQALRKGVRNFFAKYGHVRPMIVYLGNEPHSKGEEVKVDIAAYLAVYTEIKKVDPTIPVIGTSVGVGEEAYFKYEFGKWCDAYDFHTYEAVERIQEIMSTEYPALFKKYGHPKPLWATEVGLNSHGMPRQAVAAILQKKAVNFFALGGMNFSWFGFLYPDPDAEIAGSSSAAHNLFDSRYTKYAPKLDAIAYYNIVNGIGRKKFVEHKTYGETGHAFLFRDRDGDTMQAVYRDRGRADVFIPLEGVDEVEVVRVDGTRGRLSAGGKGILLTVEEEPALLLYRGGPAALPESWGASPAQVRLEAAPLVRGGVSTIELAMDGLPADRIALRAPPLWKVERSSPAAGLVRFAVEVPGDSTAQEADLALNLLGEDGKVTGQLFRRPTVAGPVALEVLPQGGQPAIKLVIQNRSPQAQRVRWEAALTGEQSLEKGEYGPVSSCDLTFQEAPSGAVDLEPGQSTEVLLHLPGADLRKVYRVRASVGSGAARPTTLERMIGGFYGVMKTANAPVLDGKLDETEWANAPVRTIGQADEFRPLPAPGKAAPDWRGAEDLSAELRFLWDANHLYLGVKVRDDVAGAPQQDAMIWAQDGLQLLIDPSRAQSRKPGKYDYAIAQGLKGPQAWCYTSADSQVPTGLAANIEIVARRDGPTRGDTTYEVAIPWSRLAPFAPAAGGNLGLTLIVNEDDGHGRDAFLTWFGNAHTKQVDTVADLVLLPD